MRNSLLVDLYELTMADVYRREGIARRPATFSLFVRALPPTRGYLVAAGLDDALQWLETLRFTPDDLAAIDRLGRFDADFLEWLAQLEFTGDVRAVPEGTIVFGDEPILEVDAPLAEAQLAETFLLNQITLQTSLATKASRVRHAAGGRRVVDFGARRAQGIDAAMKLARCCALVGIDATSNVAAADRYDLVANGTMAHSYVQAHTDEVEAFTIFGHNVPHDVVLLVDTYDTARGVEHAIAAARDLERQGIEVSAIRLDSGDLLTLARAAREQLDAAGLRRVKILASGGLDEHQIAELAAGAPIDGFGVGSSLATSADAPVLDTVYKLVVFGDRPVRKTSTRKQTLPGRKQVWRADDWSRDVIGLASEPSPPETHPLLELVMHTGVRTEVGRRPLDDARAGFERTWLAMPARYKRLTDPATHPVELSAATTELLGTIDALGDGQ